MVRQGAAINRDERFVPARTHVAIQMIFPLGKVAEGQDLAEPEYSLGETQWLLLGAFRVWNFESDSLKRHSFLPCRTLELTSIIKTWWRSILGSVLDKAVTAH
jgi:hypothetical protein